MNVTIGYGDRPIDIAVLPGDALPPEGYFGDYESSLLSPAELESLIASSPPASAYDIYSPAAEIEQMRWDECPRDGAEMSNDERAIAFTDPLAPVDIRKIAWEWMLEQGGRLSYPPGRDITPVEVLAQAGIAPGVAYSVEYLNLADVFRHGYMGPNGIGQ